MQPPGLPCTSLHIDRVSPPSHSHSLSAEDTGRNEGEGFCPSLTPNESSCCDKSGMRSTDCSITARDGSYREALGSRTEPLALLLHHPAQSKWQTNREAGTVTCQLLWGYGALTTWGQELLWPKESFTVTTEDKIQLGDLQHAPWLKIYEGHRLRWTGGQTNKMRTDPSKAGKKTQMERD